MKTFSKHEFAAIIRDKYPGSYDDLNDEKLIELWLKKFPADKDKIIEDKSFKFLNLKWFNLSVLLFFCNIVPMYVFFHPGLLYYANYVNVYKHTEDWRVVFFFILIILIFGVLNKKNKSYLVATLISISYIIGLYFYPINYFRFDEKYTHHLSDECMIYTILIIAYNTLLFLYSLKKKDNPFGI
jgi:hypothetical protein